MHRQRPTRPSPGKNRGATPQPKRTALPPRSKGHLTLVPPPPTTTRGRALVVEDDLLVQKSLVKQLNLCHLQCDVASNGSDAVRACLDQDYNLIFMDCQMPLLDGFTAVHRIRALKLFQDKPLAIIATTGTGSEAQCLEAGMDHFLSKPVLLPDVQQLIDRYLGP